MGHQCNINKNKDYKQKSFKQLIIVPLRQSKYLIIRIYFTLIGMKYLLTLFINKHFYFMRKTFTAVALMCSLGLLASRVTQNFDFG